MRILVTGAAGFIGSNFVRYWVTEHSNDQVIALDALTYAGNLENLEPFVTDGRVRFVQADIIDQPAIEKVLDAEQIDTIVNFAAESHNSLAVLDPARFFKTNVMGTQALCDAARRVGVGRLHHISTCEVYGDLDLASNESFSEISPYRPRTPYNASKAGSDHVVRCYGETFNLPITITNCCNNYGPYQFPEKVIPLFVSRAIDNKPLPVYESSDNRREWVHVLDHCRAIDLVLARGQVGETYHVGTGREASVTEIADAVLSATDRPQTLKKVVPDRPGHDRRYLLDSTKIRQELGFEPEIGFEEGLAETIKWYIENPMWWRRLIGRSPVEEGSWQDAPLADASSAQSNQVAQGDQDASGNSLHRA